MALLLMLVLIGCKREVEPEVVVEAPPAVEEVIVIPEEPAVPEAPVEVKTVLDMISEARCLDNKIEVLLTNPTDETITLARDAKVIINGLIVIDPECDKLTLAPGESTFCTDISGHFSIRTGEKNRIQINMRSERGLSIVDCEEE